jgi:hypothetical protein
MGLLTPQPLYPADQMARAAAEDAARERWLMVMHECCRSEATGLYWLERLFGRVPPDPPSRLQMNLPFQRALRIDVVDVQPASGPLAATNPVCHGGRNGRGGPRSFARTAAGGAFRVSASPARPN